MPLSVRLDRPVRAHSRYEEATSVHANPQDALTGEEVTHDLVKQTGQGYRYRPAMISTSVHLSLSVPPQDRLLRPGSAEFTAKGYGCRPSM
jgi:hypothetical protein